MNPTLAVAVVLISAARCGSGARPAPREAGTDVARHDGAAGDARDGANDARATEKTDAGCSTAGWDAGAAVVASSDQGSLILSQIRVDGTGPHGLTVFGLFSASFSRAGQLVTPPPLLVGGGHRAFGPGFCGLGTFGPCVVTTTACAIPTSPCPAPQAGKIAFGSPDSLDLPLSPNPDGTYPPNDLSGGLLFDSGDPQAVVAAGGDVPPFSMQVNAPGCVGLSRPAMIPLAADAAVGSPRYLIPRGQDLALAWTGGEAGAVVGVDLISTSPSGVVDVACSFPAGAGQGSIPQPALSWLDAGAEGYLSVYQQTSVSTHVGTFDVQFAIRNLGDDIAAPDAGTCPVNNAYVTLQ
ncbi:MAG TPA: hypothetical protein VMT03_11620 [Polyangia bacterium]|nr:hypothetical protein [Polyangia bacterium]